MELNLSPELQAKLAHIAAENNSGAEENEDWCDRCEDEGERFVRVAQASACGIWLRRRAMLPSLTPTG